MSDKYIVRREEIEAMEGVSKTHYINPNGRRVNKSLGDLTGLTGFGVHLIEVAPGFESTEFHRHLHEDECAYVLEGEAEAEIGDELTIVRAGDFIGYRAGGEAHLLRNTSDRPFRCLVVGSRLAHDVCDYPRAGKRLFRNAGMPWNLVDIDQVDERKR